MARSPSVAAAVPAACTAALGEARSERPWLRKRGGLSRTATILSDRPARIGYLGASVTAQRAGYRAVVDEWFASKSAHAPESIAAAFGAIGSAGAVFLADHLLIERRPDLCLIELTTTDLVGFSPESEIGPAVEGIVRKLAAIDCAPCFVHLYRRGVDFSDANPVIREYERVADHYSVPSINLGLHIAQETDSGRLHPEDLFRDEVHTTEQGSLQVGRLMTEALQELFAAPALEPAPLPGPLHQDHYARTQILPITDSMQRQGLPFGRGSFRFNYHYVELQPGAELEACVGRSLAGALVVVGPHSGVIELRTADSVSRHNLFDKWCHYERLSVVVFNRSLAKPASVRLSLTHEAVDHSICPVDFPGRESSVTTLKLVGLLLREDS